MASTRWYFPVSHNPSKDNVFWWQPGSSINSRDNLFKRSNPDDHSWQPMGILSLVATGQRGQQLVFRVYNSICSRPYIYVIISCSVVFLQTRREQDVKPVWCTYLSARLESAVFSTCIRLSVCPSVCTRSDCPRDTCRVLQQEGRFLMLQPSAGWYFMSHVL